MKKEQLSYGLFSERAKELQIPFSNLLGGAVLEEIVRRIGLLEQEEHLWLRNGNVLGEKQYKKKLILCLEYDFIMEKSKKADNSQTNETILRKLVKDLKEKMEEEREEHDFFFCQKEKYMKKYLLLQITAEFDDMKIPASIKIYPQWEEKKIPRKEEFISVLFPQRKITYYSYPAEGILAEKYMEIITKLELIQNIGDYYEIYYLLEQGSVDGRKVKEYIEEQCEGREVFKKENRLEMIAGYKDYSYMKKKWKVFLRSISAKEPSWETVVERFLQFFEPIWQAVTNDQVFFGDWMPELNRFL